MLIYAIEYDNPKTLQPLSEVGKWLAAWFQAVTPRTAGFNTIAIEELNETHELFKEYVSKRRPNVDTGKNAPATTALMLNVYMFPMHISTQRIV